MREMNMFNDLSDQQAAKGLRMWSDVINHAEHESQRYTVDK